MSSSHFVATPSPLRRRNTVNQSWNDELLPGIATMSLYPGPVRSNTDAGSSATGTSSML